MRVSQDKVLIMPLHNAADDKMADTSNRTRYILWSMVLVAIAVCFVCLPAAGTLGPTAYKLTLRRPEPVIQVYTPAQATRAAKAAVAQLQLIEQRRPNAVSTANPLALPKTKDTDLSTERRRQ